MSPFSQWWGYSHVLQVQLYIVLGIKLRASRLIGTHSTNQPKSPALELTHRLMELTRQRSAGQSASCRPLGPDDILQSKANRLKIQEDGFSSNSGGENLILFGEW